MPRLLWTPLLNVALCAGSAIGHVPIIKNGSSSSVQPFGGKEQQQHGGGQAPQAVVLVDAGSSGSKAFAFCPEKAMGKLYTTCSDKQREAGKTNLGIAALAYSKSECEWTLGTDKKNMLPMVAEANYADALLRLLSDTYTAESGKVKLDDVKNKDAVPMLATAGMRLISQAENEKVWSFLCGKEGSGLKLAPPGEKCGTIPGTTEAYYEFLANAVVGSGNRVLTGTFTIGGASAQMAIPLKTEADVASFKALRDNVAKDIDCRKLTLADGKQAPIFNRVRQGGPRVECVDDYITYKPKGHIKATGSIKSDNIKYAEIEGLGLVSFLGLRGRGSFVAGGINEIQNWAEEEGCDVKGANNFSHCVEKLKVALSEDVMWRHVTKYFETNALNVNSFSYNTHAARPKSAGMPHVDGDDQAWELEAELKQACGKHDSIRFGYGDSNTCMRAMFTSMYITSFFSRTSGHTSTELHFDPVRDWAEGMLEEAKSFLQVGAEQSAGGARELLKVPVHRHQSGYADGAALHFAALDAAGLEGWSQENGKSFLKRMVVSTEQ